MLNEDEEPRPKAQMVAALPLDRLGIDELRGYIAALRAEIGRVEAEIAKKSSHRSAADRFFRSPG